VPYSRRLPQRSEWGRRGFCPNEAWGRCRAFRISPLEVASDGAATVAMPRDDSGESAVAISPLGANPTSQRERRFMEGREQRRVLAVKEARGEPPANRGAHEYESGTTVRQTKSRQVLSSFRDYIALVVHRHLDLDAVQLGSPPPNPVRIYVQR
jgi:hypothetical protein